MNRIDLAARIILSITPLLCAAQDETVLVLATSVVDANPVPAFVLEIPESVSDVLIADTQSATLHRFSRTESGIVNIEQRYMSIGQNGVGKKRAWDRKTPLGIYFITEQLDMSNLDPKYGIAAYPLDYPNAWDRHMQRTGDGIWLHGVDEIGSTRPPRDTDGCLALPNDDLLSLANILDPLVTPVIVTRELIWSTPDELEVIRTELRFALELWRRSLENRDLQAFLSLYSDDFRYRELDKDAWASNHLVEFEAQDLESVNIGDVLLVADPEEPGLYLSRFIQEFVSATGTVVTTKRLYWLRRGDNFWQILAEGAG